VSVNNKSIRSLRKKLTKKIQSSDSAARVKVRLYNRKEKKNNILIGVKKKRNGS